MLSHVQGYSLNFRAPWLDVPRDLRYPAPSDGVAAVLELGPNEATSGTAGLGRSCSLRRVLPDSDGTDRADETRDEHALADSSTTDVVLGRELVTDGARLAERSSSCIAALRDRHGFTGGQ